MVSRHIKTLLAITNLITMDALLPPLTFALSAALAVMMYFYCLPRAERWGLMDTPCGQRKKHHRSTPLIGGLIIWAGLMALAVIKPVMGTLPYSLFLGTVTVLVGLADDRHELPAQLRLVTHLAIGLAMALIAGVQLSHLGELLPGVSMELGLLALPITCFAVAAAMNSVNMMDGADGLAGSLSLVPVAAVAILAGQAGNHQLLVTALALAGGLCVFLLLNFPLPWRHHASCFMGDTGSTLLGLMVAWLLIRGCNDNLFSPVVALYLLAMPLIDTAGIMLRRLLRGVSLTTPGRDHLHHVLIDAGMKNTHMVYMMSALATAIACLGLILDRQGVPEFVLFGVFMGMLLTNLLALRSAEKAKEVLRSKVFTPR